MATLMELLQQLVRKEGSQRAAAERIGISESRFGRALKGEGGMLSEPKCLALALELRVSPAVVFRAAGKSEFVEMLERWYGPPRPAEAPFALSDEERMVVESWRQLGSEPRRTMKALLDELNAASPSRRRSRKGKRSGAA